MPIYLPNSRNSPSLRVNRLLYMRIHLDHLVVKLRMFPHQYLGIPCHGYEQCIHARAEWCREDVRNLSTDQECKRNDHGRECSSRIVARLGKDDKKIGEQGAGVANKGGAHTEDGAYQALVHEGIDAAILDHPRVLISVDLRVQQGKGKQALLPSILSSANV